METKIIEKTFCPLCMEQHEVKIITQIQKTIFKKEEVEYSQQMVYCENADEFYIPEDLIKTNDISMKDAYRRKTKLLTSEEIIALRKQYGASQKDFSKILGWGELTMERYENHQIQDQAHDSILSEIRIDPMFFQRMLIKNQKAINDNSFQKIKNQTKKVLKNAGDPYLVQSIMSEYEDCPNPKYVGNKMINISKIVSMVNYFASKISDLGLVKLMKLFWYSDFMHYRDHGTGITGFCYFIAPRGALPKAYERIILLDGIERREEEFDDGIIYKYVASKSFSLKSLTKDELFVIDKVIDALGALSTKEIVDKMHEEEAFILTEDRHPINYDLSKNLRL